MNKLISSCFVLFVLMISACDVHDMDIKSGDKITCIGGYERIVISQPYAKVFVDNYNQNGNKIKCR